MIKEHKFLETFKELMDMHEDGYHSIDYVIDFLHYNTVFMSRGYYQFTDDQLEYLEELVGRFNILQAKANNNE